MSEGVFVHTGIVNPGGLQELNRAMFLGRGLSGVQFAGVLMRQGLRVPDGYRTPRMG